MTRTAIDQVIVSTMPTRRAIGVKIRQVSAEGAQSVVERRMRGQRLRFFEEIGALGGADGLSPRSARRLRFRGHHGRRGSRGRERSLPSRASAPCGDGRADKGTGGMLSSPIRRALTPYRLVPPYWFVPPP
jgi:hypothetical protein